MATLRAPDGCPWDQIQTLETLKQYLVEETYEVLEALDDNDPSRHCEELGDLLLQVVFQAQIRQEEGHFDAADVALAITDKMERRHPHVFGESLASDPESVRKSWHALKAAEKKEKGGDQSALAGIPRALPGLLRALRLTQKAALVGFDWPTLSGVRAKLDEELQELDEAIDLENNERIGEELGDVLFTVVNLCRHLGIDPENALQGSNQRFETRFRTVEDMCSTDGESVSEKNQDALNVLWGQAKTRLGS